MRVRAGDHQGNTRQRQYSGRVRRRTVKPGDVIVADDDGICVVPRLDAAATIEKCVEREKKEAKVRARLQAGELGLDIYDMRKRLAERGLVYKDAPSQE